MFYKCDGVVGHILFFTYFDGVCGLESKKINLNEGALDVSIQVIACVGFYILSALTNVMVLGAFTESWLMTYGWSRLELSQMYGYAMGLVAMTITCAGLILEKMGFRKSFVWAHLILGTSFVCISYLPNGHKFYFTVLLFVVQWVGQGFLLVACRSRLLTCVSAKGLWSGFQESLGTIMVSLLPFLTLHFIDAFGWHKVMRVEGLVFITVSLLSLILTFPQNKCGEKSGCAPWFLIKNIKFWLINIVVNLPVLLSSGFFFHLEAICHKWVIDITLLQFLWVPQVICIVCFQLVLGAISLNHSWSLRTLLAFICLTQLVWVIGLRALPSLLGQLLYVVGSGLGWGCFGVWINIVWERNFGSNFNSFCLSWAVFMGLLFNALGPLLFNFMI